MTYVHRMVGPDETLVGVARLHWIYLFKGILGFVLCLLMAYAINTAATFFITTMFHNSAVPASVAAGAYVLNSYLYKFAFFSGALIFLIYLIKVMGTEIGLTSRRLILKEGLMFVKTHEVDIEEIRGERMDLGWFGRFLDYAMITLDCRFIEDITTPAIEKPERFIRALHKLRSDASDSVITIAAHPDQNGVPRAHVARKGPPPMPEHGTVSGLDHEAAQKKEQMPTAGITHPAGEQPIPPTPEGPNAAPGATLPSHPPAGAAPIDPKMVAEIVKQAMPQIVEEMAAQGLVVSEAAAEPVSPDTNILTEFVHVSGSTDPKAIH